MLIPVCIGATCFLLRRRKRQQAHRNRAPGPQRVKREHMASFGTSIPFQQRINLQR